MGPISLDIFCRVIDNYGDAGVCLHLARSLSTGELTSTGSPTNTGEPTSTEEPLARTIKQPFCVRLFCDNLQVLHTIATAADYLNPNLTFCSWEAPLAHYDPSEVIITAFSCRFDEPTLKTLQQATTKPLIINLEYLSAESWVEDCHTLPSPVDGLTSHFFFPGFTARTGGLNLDPAFLAQCQAVLAQPSTNDSFKVSLFGYHNPAVKRIIAALSYSGRSCELKVFAGLAQDNLNQLYQQNLQVGESFKPSPELTCTIAPMTDHNGYDQELLSSDFNLVRGEDSIVRAMHTGHPFLWQIYPQEEQAHIVKLQAFLDCMERTLRTQGTVTDLESRMALLRTTMLSYNEALPAGTEDPLSRPDFLALFLERCAPVFSAWARYLCAQPTLSARLTRFILSKLT